MRPLPTALLALALAAAAPARADEAGGGARAERPNVRASHHVDVIAPGERVQTVLDRTRASQPGDGAARGAGRGEGGAKEEGGRAGPEGGMEEGGHTEMGGTGQAPLRPDARPDGGHRHEGMRPKG